MVSLSSAFDYFASIILLGTLVAGFVSVSSGLGSLSSITQKVVSKPTSFGFGLIIFYIGYDTWVPALPKTFLDQYSLGWLTYLYPFTDGYIMHFSIWTLIFALLMAVIWTWIILHVFDIDFWYRGLGISVLIFVVAWYVWGWIAWGLIHVGGSMMGLSNEQVFTLWHGSVSVTQSFWLQLFFLFSIPITSLWIISKIGGKIL